MFLTGVVMRKISVIMCAAFVMAAGLYLSCTTCGESVSGNPYISEMYVLAHPSDVKETSCFSSGERIYLELSVSDSDMDIRRVVIRGKEEVCIALPPQPECEALYYVSVPDPGKGKHRLSVSVEDGGGNRSNEVTGYVTVKQ